MIPEFVGRAADAALGATEGLSRSQFRDRLETLGIELAVAGTALHPIEEEGYLLAVNLAARLYPRLALDAPAGLTQRAAALATAINPAVDFIAGRQSTHRLTWSSASAESSADSVAIAATGWTVLVDRPPPSPLPPAVPAALAAAALGMGEVFRCAFADWLPDGGRSAPHPWDLDLVTMHTGLAAAETARPAGPAGTMGGPPLDLGPVHLAGAGAIGQAALHTLRLAPVKGTLFVVDPGAVSLPKLQRYVLTDHTSVNASKVALAADALKDTGLSVVPVATRWGGDRRSGPSARVVLVGLDTAVDRVGVAAALPERTYNAWTQPTDLGWSRHEAFGHQACLACLYPPRHRTPTYQQMAKALRQHPLRILGYLTQPDLPITTPLPAIPALRDIPVPPEADRWTQVPLLDDLVAQGIIPADQVPYWSEATIRSLHTEGICGGAIVTERRDEVDTDVVVPLAHQSVLAGVMLATQLLVAADPNLSEQRPTLTQGRLDLRRAPPTDVATPNARRSTCICADPDYLAAYNARWGA